MITPLATQVWLDFETTDLDPAGCSVLEAAVVLTDDALTELARIDTLIRPPHDIVARLQENPTVLNMHAESGLLDAILSASPESIPALADFETRVLALLAEHAEPHAKLCLAGTGVGHFDRLVIAAQMPELDKKLTYWSLDVGPGRRQYQKATGGDVCPPIDKIAHRAAADIDEALRVGRALQNVYQRDHAAALVSSSAEDRVLTGLALVESYTDHDVITTTNDGKQHHADDTGHMLLDLTGLWSDTETVIGLMDAGSLLLSVAAEAAGVGTGEIVARIRSQVLADAAL
jgi:oligoribonuclease